MNDIGKKAGSALAYRPDIDGLRAIAVLAVLFFHADLGFVPGGYAGVDIFFVISGYLISRLIVGEIQDDNFSLLRFYERRIRRLFPALFAMLAVALVAGAVILLPQDFTFMSRNAFGAAAFVSNIAYWTQTGYFEGDAKVRVLLHTWSLAVEEQVYIIYPMILMLVLRKWATHIKSILLGLATLSFAACVWMTNMDPSTAFYLMPFRIWEFLVGALLAVGLFKQPERPLTATLAGLAGLAILAATFVIFDDLTVFPGAAALVPCLGTALVIWAGKDAISGRILSVSAMRFVGKISYSVYLWHWPLFVFVNYMIIGKLTFLQNVGLAGVAIGLGFLSWRFIEMPFRRPYDETPQRSVFALGGASIVLITCVSAAIYFSGGLPDRFKDRTVKLASYEKSMNPESDICEKVELQLAVNSRCTIGNTENASVFLWGDSHAGALFGALDQVAKDSGSGIVYGASPQCPPLLGAGTSVQCVEGNRKRLDYVLKNDEIRTVILAARWSLYLEGRFVSTGEAETNNGAPKLIGPDGEPYPLFSDAARHHFRDSIRNLVQILLANGKHVVLVYPIPETGYNIPQTLALMSTRGENPADFTVAKNLYVERQWRATQILGDLGHHRLLTRVYPARVFCPTSRCLTFAHGAPLYFDSHHLSVPGALMLKDTIAEAIGRTPTV
ncbi:acyltransferase family protein [Sphingorhabdus sp.]|uniref:acyltransferase family protein n=1 Tax=Sphingorhabdus sp. TaxID=1902408 RepID=UPI003593FEC0